MLVLIFKNKRDVQCYCSYRGIKLKIYSCESATVDVSRRLLVVNYREGRRDLLCSCRPENDMLGEACVDRWSPHMDYSVVLSRGFLFYFEKYLSSPFR